MKIKLKNLVLAIMALRKQGQKPICLEKLKFPLMPIMAPKPQEEWKTFKFQDSTTMIILNI